METTEINIDKDGNYTVKFTNDEVRTGKLHVTLIQSSGMINANTFNEKSSDDSLQVLADYKASSKQAENIKKLIMDNFPNIKNI